MSEDKNTKPKKQKRTQGYGPLSAIIVTLGAFFSSQLFAGLIIGTYGLLRGIDTEQLVTNITDSIYLQFFYIFFSSLFSVYLIYIFMKRRKINFAQIGLGRGPKTKDILPAILVFGLYFVSLTVVVVVLSLLFPAIDIDQEQQIGFNGANGFAQLSLVFISLVLIPSFVEEFMIRGFLYSGLKNKLSIIKAAFLASILFAIAHLQFGSGEPLLWVAAIDTFLLSLFLIGLREKTESLWSGMLVHAIKNSVAFTMLFIVTWI